MSETVGTYYSYDKPIPLILIKHIEYESQN